MNNETKAQYKRMSFKGNKVWAAVLADDSLDVQNGKVKIKYNLDQDYEYQVKVENLKPENKAVPAKAKAPKKTTAGPAAAGKSTSGKTGVYKAAEGTLSEKVPANAVIIYTDGASSGNPGPSGIGVLLKHGEKQKEISKFIGSSTNNIAELTAIKVALETLKRDDLPVRLFTDSSYCIGLLTKGWKPKKNSELVFEIRKKMKQFSDLKLIKVKGHAGISENETADRLATSAIKEGL